MRITGNASRNFMCKNRIACITGPFLHIIGKGNTYTFCLLASLGVHACSIVEHYELLAKTFRLIPIHSTLVLREFFPPLGVLIINMQNRLIGRLPFMRLRNRFIGTCHAHIQRFTDRLVTGTRTSQISHPMTAFILL